MGKYTPATFQPTIRQDWAGILSYISDQEKAEILTAIFKYPNFECKSKFWLETIKSDLDLQYESFKKSCEAKSRGIRNRWGKISITDVKDMNNICNTDVIDAKSKSKSKSKSIGKSESKSESIGESESIGKSEPKTQNIKNDICGAFIPPTLEEVLEYAKQQHESKLMGGFYCTKDTATNFYLHYAKQNWILGNGNHMGNWKIALKGWARKEEQKQND